MGESLWEAGAAGRPTWARPPSSRRGCASERILKAFIVMECNHKERESWNSLIDDSVEDC